MLLSHVVNETNHPVYRLMDGAIHVQEIPNGPWTALDKREADHLLSRFDGLDLAAIDRMVCNGSV